MAAGDITRGVRLPDDASHEDIVDGPAGCYKLGPPLKDGSTRYLQFRLPNGVFGMIPVGKDQTRPPIWGLVEHDDRTVTTSPSILMHPTPGLDDAGWHGFLERGVWREV